MAESQERKVVVCYFPELLKHRSKECYAARIRPLGLTAYGSTSEDAMGRVEELLASFVVWYRLEGLLEGILDRSGIEWYWEDEYEGELPIKYVSGTEYVHKIRSEFDVAEAKAAVNAARSVVTSFGTPVGVDRSFMAASEAAVALAA